MPQIFRFAYCRLESVGISAHFFFIHIILTMKAIKVHLVVIA